MKKRISLFAIVAAIAALAAVPFLYAGPGGHGPGGHRMHGFDGAGVGPLGHLAQMKEELGLTDQQLGQVTTIFTELKEKNATYRDQLRGGFHDVAQTLLANPDDLAGARALMERQAAAESAMKANMLEATSKALKVLTVEQRTKLGTMLEQHAAHMGHFDH